MKSATGCKKAASINLRLLSDRQHAEEILAKQPGVGQIAAVEEANNGGEPAGQELEISFTGDDDAAANLLEALILNKVRILSFTETHTGLEEVFLRLTKGEVQ